MQFITGLLLSFLIFSCYNPERNCQDFKTGTYAYSWNNRRWNDLLKEGWITVWRERNRTTQKYNIYKVSFKCKQLISRMYRIILIVGFQVNIIALCFHQINTLNVDFN